MAIYDLGTASLDASGEVTGVGTAWNAPLTLIRVGATIIFKTDPVKIYTISEIISDTRINVYNPNSETVPAGTGYAILAHDGITVQGLAQDVAETLRYYQDKETELASSWQWWKEYFGDGSALPVGVPVPWPSATPPTGWLKCNGAPFSAEEYPELAKAYPTNKLPDLRGEFIRGWDDGREVDSGRKILSAQGDAIRNIIGTFGNGQTGVNAAISFNESNGVFVRQSALRNTIGNTTIIPNTPNNYHLVNFDASRVVPTASENRPRNIAFNYIVRAV